MLHTLESNLNYFHQILPRLDARRGLVNLAGHVMKTLFGTGMDSDIHLLHDVINDFQRKNADITHSLSNQLTYVKDLSTATKINSDAIRNLYIVIKENLVQSHNQFQQVTRDILWLNITLRSQNTLHSTFKQLELTLAQLTQQIDDLFDAIQCL